MSAESEFLAAALGYAGERGWPVFPCNPDTKQPLVAGGFKAATTSAETIRQWWARWPDAMIGLPTGPVTGLLVVDLDPAPGQSAGKLLESLREAVGLTVMQPCPVLETPRGGLHLYFAYPPDEQLGNRAGIIPGVDVRGDGGYVIAAPSRRWGDKSAAAGLQGKRYAFSASAGLDDLALERPGAALLRFLHSKRKAPGSVDAQARRAPATAHEQQRRYALAALDAELVTLRGQGEGTRNDALNKAAYNLGQLVGAGALSEAVAEAGLVEAAMATGLGREESYATAKSGLLAGRKAPRDLSTVQPRTPSLRGFASPRREGEENNEPPFIGDDETLDDDRLDFCARQGQNDLGNAERLYAHFGGVLLVVREIGPHFWTGSHWQREGAEQFFQAKAQEVARRIAREPDFMEVNKGEADAAFEERKKRRLRFAVSSGNTARLANMVREVAPKITIAPDRLDADPLAINTCTGTLRIRRESYDEPDPDDPSEEGGRRIQGRRWVVRLDAHEQTDYLSRIVAANYDPAAHAPRWLAFLERFQPNPEIRDFLQAFHGYALTGLMGEQVFVFNYGLGANGKTTFMEALGRLMGSYASVLPAEALTGDMQRRGDQATPEFARLPGARLVRCAELPRGQGFRESTLKMLTGGEPMLVRHLHQEFFEMRPTFKPIGSGNDKPHIGGVDEGIWRRLKLVPWRVAIPKHDRRPMERVLGEFAEEAAGILNWLLDGLLRYMEYGLIVPDEIQQATESYRKDMDPVGEFIASCVVAEEGGEVTARELYLAYCDWAAANSVKAFAERGFAQIMAQKGFEKDMGRIRKYLNIRLEGVPSGGGRQDEISL